MPRPRALITGANGFTGRYVVSELEAAGYQVIGLSHGNGQGGREDVQADVLDRQALRDAVASISPDVVLHLAGISFVAHGDVDEIYRVNVTGTRNLLEALAALATPPSMVVLASSANVYGNATVEPVTEDTLPAPTNDYAVSKLAMEYMASLWRSQLPIVITRPFNYTGVGQPAQFLLPKIVAHFRRAESSIELGNTNVFRDFADVRDVARVYRKLVETRPIGSVLNICSGVGHTLDEILETMAVIAGYRIDVKVNPAFVRKDDVRRLVGSNRALMDAIGFVPSIPLSDTLSWMYEGDRASA
ncbi:NAD-dependent epimerase/dehydratase family protein [Dyella acidiphila]|uniref:GDP-mannose 4,6-dehydratase n=1 Tax=Dyella acidiphila TaxID=2775866 RepID=A0ABR9G560_9GAMM|nr:NAD-dependent epimerase/dehydratase family protein [Dyella acidiphila]MBE1159197.1 GDP-mannose 4,6-dehydratase [Dyella acidiphila]